MRGTNVCGGWLGPDPTSLSMPSPVVAWCRTALTRVGAGLRAWQDLVSLTGFRIAQEHREHVCFQKIN